MYTGGTKKANEVIVKYKKTGYIVDFYTDQHIQSLDEDVYGISVDDLRHLDKKFGTSYRGHMLCIHLEDRNSELIADLFNTYPPFGNLFNLRSEFDGWLHKPDVFIINLATREILCVGLGRKNGCFSFELHRYLQSKGVMGQYEGVYSESEQKSSTDCSDEFFRLDHFSIAKTVLHEFRSLGEALFARDNLPGNADVMVTLNQEDGLYYFDDFDGEDGMTAEEVKELQDQYEELQEAVDDSMRELRKIFPKLEEGDLNTGDY